MNPNRPLDSPGLFPIGETSLPGRCVIMSNLALPKTGCTSAESKQAWLCTRFAQSLLRCFGFTENRLHLGQTQTVPVWFGSRFALFFESRTQSRTAEQAERRIKRSLNYAEAKPALAAEQQQYAPSFSLSAPCILLTLTHRLRFVSNPYFDTPSCCMTQAGNLPEA